MSWGFLKTKRKASPPKSAFRFEKGAANDLRPRAKEALRMQGNEMAILESGKSLLFLSCCGGRFRPPSHKATADKS